MSDESLDLTQPEKLYKEESMSDESLDLTQPEKLYSAIISALANQIIASEGHRDALINDLARARRSHEETLGKLDDARAELSKVNAELTAVYAGTNTDQPRQPPAELAQRINATLREFGTFDTGLTHSLTALFRQLWKEAPGPN